jgi:hypothetical protein
VSRRDIEQRRIRGESPLPVRREIDLLATIKEAERGDAFLTKSFGNIIELGGRGLILESSRELPVGTQLTVDVVFPGQPRGDDPFAHLECVIRKIHDGSNLQYDLEIVEMSERTRQRLETYLKQPAIVRGY